METVLIFVLIGLVIGQQVFFSFQMQALVDKLMSRSFIEYKRGKSIKSERPKPMGQFNVPLPEDFGDLHNITQ